MHNKGIVSSSSSVITSSQKHLTSAKKKLTNPELKTLEVCKFNVVIYSIEHWTKGKPDSNHDFDKIKSMVKTVLTH